MTKVEELRATTILYANKDGLLEEHVDRLIAAARQEGAEEERETIQKFAHPLMVGAGGVPSLYTVPASVLAPKEEENKKSEQKETAFDKAGVVLRGQHGMDW